MVASDFRVSCPAGREEVQVTARVYGAPGDSAPWLVLAPGAGAGHDHPFMVSFARGIAARGVNVVTFNFPYIEQGRRSPDRNDTLEACWRRVIEAVRARAGETAPLFAGGKSMGGRIASQVAAHPEHDAVEDLAGLVFLGYPLHPPGRRQDRTAHWPAIRIPALFVQGSRDSFASPDDLREAVHRYGGDARVKIVEGGDHSFKVPKRAVGGEQQVYAEIQDAVAAWIADAAGKGRERSRTRRPGPHAEHEGRA